MEYKLRTKPGYSIFLVDVTLKDNTYLEVPILATNAEDALTKAILKFPNYVSVGVGYTGR